MLITRTRYRNKQEIIFLALSSIEERGSGVTHILYQAFLSFTQVKEYLKDLEGLGMVTYDSDLRTWHITSKGRQYVKVYSAIKRELGE